MIQKVLVPDKKSRASHKTLSVKLLIVYFFIILYFTLFFLLAENYLIFFSTLIVAVVCLWNGPIAAIGSNGKRRMLEPAIIFNSAMFYYVIKGIPLSWEEIPLQFTNIGSRYVIEDYPLVALYILLGVIAWNWAYQIVLNPSWHAVQNTLNTKNSNTHDQFTNIRFGVVLLSALGTISFFILFWTIRRDIFVFLTEPVQRAYLADSNYGVGISSGYFLLFGVFMLPISSILWLADLGRRNRRVSIPWSVHALVCVIFLLLVSPRSNVISYAISILIVYSLVIGKLPPIIVGVTSLLILIYASFTTIWRGIMGSMQTPTLSAGISTLGERTDLVQQFTKFFSSPSLADIRVFLLVESFYGKVLPLKYGSTLLRIATQLVPRSLWPNKPYDLGNEIGRLYDSSTLSGTPPGFFAEMYMNFHILGVILGGILLGALLATIYREWILRHPNTLVIVLYAILAPRVFLIPSSTIANIVISILIFFSGVVFVTKIIPKVTWKKQKYEHELSEKKE